MLEISCTLYKFNTVKYQSLITAIENLGYKCKLIVLVSGSLGHVHGLAVSGSIMDIELLSFVGLLKKN